MPIVSATAAAADAPSQASAPGAQWGPMLQAQRTLSAVACPWRAAALRSRERNTLGRRPGGPCGVWQERWPPVEGAGVVVHEETVAQLRPYAGRSPQTPYPSVPAVSRQAQKL